MVQLRMPKAMCVVFVLIRPLQGRQARFTKFYYVQGAH